MRMDRQKQGLRSPRGRRPCNRSSGGNQEIVADLEQALRRIEEHLLRYEAAMVRERMNVITFIGKILIIRREWIDGRITVILVCEPDCGRA